MAFLEVLTRTYGGRPAMLARNVASLAKQTDPDYMHHVIVDHERRGVAWAVGNLANVEATGEWVWVLDDDDLCCHPTLIRELKEIDAAMMPDVIMVRALHEAFGMLPGGANWGQAPVLGNIGTSCYIVRRYIWNLYRSRWLERYDGDYWWIHHLWSQGCEFYWHDVIAAHYPQQSTGVPE